MNSFGSQGFKFYIGFHFYSTGHLLGSVFRRADRAESSRFPMSLHNGNNREFTIVIGVDEMRFKWACLPLMVFSEGV